MGIGHCRTLRGSDGAAAGRCSARLLVTGMSLSASTRALLSRRPLETVSERPAAPRSQRRPWRWLLGVAARRRSWRSIRTAHDQQRAGHKNPILGAVQRHLQGLYVTVIRGTPMMVQLLIMSFVIFASSRNYTMIGILAPGHQLRRLCGGDHPRRPHVGGPRPDGGRPQPGAELLRRPCALSSSRRPSRTSCRPWATSSSSCSRIPPSSPSSAARS